MQTVSGEMEMEVEEEEEAMTTYTTRNRVNGNETEMNFKRGAEFRLQKCKFQAKMYANSLADSIFWPK